MASLNHARTVYENSRVAAADPVSVMLIPEPVIWKLLLLTALAYLIWSDKISIVLGPVTAGDLTEQSGGEKVKAAFLDFPATPRRERKSLTEVEVILPPGALNNVTFAIDPDFARRNGLDKSEMETRLLKCRDYVARYAPLAVEEMRHHGIPASVTLAQSLLESNAGASLLARKTNNHFGIKCFSKRCKRGHCANFTDDSHKDFFVKYAGAKGSFQAHSRFLKNSGRYRHLFELDSTDYRSWVRGLAKAGYATDKKYGDKLIAIIQTLGLERFDREN